MPTKTITVRALYYDPDYNKSYGINTGKIHTKCIFKKETYIVTIFCVSLQNKYKPETI